MITATVLKWIITQSVMRATGIFNDLFLWTVLMCVRVCVRACVRVSPEYILDLQGAVSLVKPTVLLFRLYYMYMDGH